MRTDGRVIKNDFLSRLEGFAKVKRIDDETFKLKIDQDKFTLKKTKGTGKIKFYYEVINGENKNVFTTVEALIRELRPKTRKSTLNNQDERLKRFCEEVKRIDEVTIVCKYKGVNYEVITNTSNTGYKYLLINKETNKMTHHNWFTDVIFEIRPKKIVNTANYPTHISDEIMLIKTSQKNNHKVYLYNENDAITLTRLANEQILNRVTDWRYDIINKVYEITSVRK